MDSGRSSSIAITTTNYSPRDDKSSSSSSYPTAEQKKSYSGDYSEKISSFTTTHATYSAAPGDEIGIDFIENDENLNETMDSRAGYENLVCFRRTYINTPMLINT